MPDVYTTIADQDESVVEQLAPAMELRARDPRQRAFVDEYLAGVALPPGATVVEIGCGTGAISRLLAARPEVGRVIGVDPSPVLIRMARELAEETAGLTYEVGDGAATPLDDADALAAAGTIGPDAAEALEAEARRRAAGGTFFGHIAYLSVVGRTP